jgi:nitrate/TMAO reductase-like tetraheme cytochrome c subunit
MTELPVAAPDPKKKKKRKRRLRVALIALGVLVVLFIVSVQVTSSSRFCSSCHYMKPFYQSWQESKHSGVECKVCHYPPGFRSKIRAKLEGLVMVGRYWTKLYLKSKPWAEIQDESCLQSGCHDKRLLEGRVQFGKVVFDHKAHFEDLKRGKQLRCTSCHSQIVQGQHITVTESSCFICHFKKSESHPEIGSCAHCHRKDDLSGRTDVRYDHTVVFQNEFGCEKCHSQVVQGDGAVPRENCYKCHFERERLDRYDDTDLIHQRHITANKIECDQCHLPIQHKIVKDIETIADCRTCHTGSHQAQKILFLGTGGKGVDHPVPNVMFEKGLSCKGCHIFHETTGGRLIPSETLTSAPQACESCHGRGFARILHNWEKATISRLAEVRAIYSRAAAEVASGSKQAEAKPLLAEAAFNMDIVERGKSVHNMTYAQDLLSAAVEKIRAALAAAGSAYAPALPAGLTRETPNACLNCHAGIEELSPEAFGMIFPHKAHVVGRKLDCEKCHSNARRHGELIASKASCAACHHLDLKTKTCAACHPLQQTLYEGGTLAGVRIPKDLMAEAGADCAACHLDKAQKVVRPDAGACVACHDENYRSTFQEWRETVAKRAADLRTILREAAKRPLDDAAKTALRTIETVLRTVETDGSGGIHNFAFFEDYLSAAAKTVRERTAVRKE